MDDGTMRLARVHGPGDVRLDEVAVPRAAAGEVVVRVAACGICGSDLGYIAQGGLGWSRCANLCLSAMNLPARSSPSARVCRAFTPACDVLVVPDIDESLDEEGAKRRFWRAFRTLGRWHDDLPPY